MAKILSSLVVGTKVKDATSKYYNKPLIWKVADKNHSGYPANSVTLITDQIITLKCFDGAEPNNSDDYRKNYGNNRYIHSNIRRWLNSSAGAGAWYAAQYSADTPPNSANVTHNPYDTQAGFLNAFSSNFLNALLTTTLTVARNIVTDGGGYETLTDKLFLASSTEVGLANENNIVEGAKLALFTDNASRIATPTAEAVSNGHDGVAGAAWYWWLRTPNALNSCGARYVDAVGVLNNYSAFNGNYGVRPLCNLLSSILVSDTTDADGCYRIFNRAPTAPATINVPASIYENKSAAISWTAATDPDGDAITYKLERTTNGGAWTQLYSGGNVSFSDSITTAMNTLQYRVKAIDTTGTESAYTTSTVRNVIHNRAPTAPATINVPTSIYENKSTVISWVAANDPDGDTITYKLERALNGGAWTQVYSGGNLSFSDSITTAMNTLQYRVKAVDAASTESAYTASTVRNVIHNSSPVISGTNADIGVKSTEVSYQYTIIDAENDIVTATEKLDNATLRTYPPMLGSENTMTVDGNAFTALPNTQHTLAITAVDSKSGQSTRTITFTKQSDGFSVVLVQPIAAETHPKRVNLLVKRSIPDGALFKVEVCNNSFDNVPIWEDATKSIFQNTAHVFTNNTQHSLQAGLNIRVTVSRNTAKGECWVSEIAGNFE